MTWAAVMTGKGPGALATIQSVFEPVGSHLQDRIGQIRLGNLVSERQILDQVILGQEAPDTWAIHCHGNPLITEAIMTTLAQQGVTLITAIDMMTRLIPDDTITAEARVALSQAKTLMGCRLLHAQIEHGLSQTVRRWNNGLSLATLQRQCHDILERSRWIHAYFNGLSAVLIGPPNSGKSTLLNTLSGCNKAIVTDISGTTRDTVEAEVVIEPLCLHLIDTAGLDLQLHHPLDVAFQQKSMESLDRVDLVLVVLDRHRDARQCADIPLETIQNRTVITILNKSDLPARLKRDELATPLTCSIDLCAQQPEQMPRFIQHIQDVLHLNDIDPTEPIVFTNRQRDLLTCIMQAHDLETAQVALREL